MTDEIDRNPGLGGPVSAGPFVPVIQADREAAIACGRDHLRWTPRQIEITAEGKGDTAPLVQALARHRIASIEALLSEKPA